MKLDRNNYEEFFLLYVDNELTAEQRRSVEQFVQEHPDLAMELDILQQTVLPADNSVVFTGKDSLLKNGSGSLINMSNYEEYLISYIDNELNASERNAFEKFLAAHPAVKEELGVYQQTKLEPEEKIVFANKEILYRKEEKVRVISMQWWKIAVAAAVILVAGMGTFIILNKKDTTTPGTSVVKTTTDKKSTPTPVVTDDNKEADKQKTEKPSVLKTVQDNVAAVITKDAIKTKPSSPEKLTEEKIQTKKSVPQNFVSNNSEALVKNEISVKKENAANTDKNKAVDNRIIPSVNESASDLKNTIASLEKNTAKQNTNNDAVTKEQEKAYNNKETAQEDFDAVYASNNESKNKKLRGFFRKATRVFEKRTNISATDDTEGKILIGALAVKLK